jgi:hypothetical protein
MRIMKEPFFGHHEAKSVQVVAHSRAVLVLMFVTNSSDYSAPEGDLISP